MTLLTIPREHVQWGERRQRDTSGLADQVPATHVSARITVSGNRDTSYRESVNAEEIQLGLIRCEPGTLLMLNVKWERFPPPGSTIFEVSHLDTVGLLEDGRIGPATWNRIWRAELVGTGFMFAGQRELWVPPTGDIYGGHWARVLGEDGKPPYEAKSWRELLS